jgi:hypothetical protein
MSTDLRRFDTVCIEDLHVAAWSGIIP